MYQERFGAAYTPLLLRRLIWAIVGVSIGAALLDPLIRNSFGTSGPQEFLSLSGNGILRGFLWQIITYPFVMQPFGSLSFGFFIELFFSAYVLWAFGGAISGLQGVKPYMRMMAVSALVAALGGLLGMLFSGYDYYIAGPTPLIFSTLLVWSMFHPEAELLLFFTIPVLARWLVAGMLGMSILLALSQGHWAALLHYLGACGAAYLYATAAWELHSPFQATQRMDRWLVRYGLSFRQKWSERAAQDVASQKSKIVDMRTGKNVMRDEQFMDAMLEKISKYGTASLSWRERWRMHRISKRQQK